MNIIEDTFQTFLKAIYPEGVDDDLSDQLLQAYAFGHRNTLSFMEVTASKNEHPQVGMFLIRNSLDEYVNKRKPAPNKDRLSVLCLCCFLIMASCIVT